MKTPPVIIASVLLFLTAMAGTAAAQSAEESTKEGMRSLSMMDYDGAISRFDAALREEPPAKEAAVIYAHRGECFDGKNEPAKAMKDYNKALSLDPGSAVSYLARGKSYERSGDHDKAIADYNEAIRLDPNQALVYISRGVAYSSKGMYDKAIEDQTKAISLLNPATFEPYYYRAFYYKATGEFGKAVEDLKTALRLNPNNSILLARLAWMLATCPQADVRDGKKALEYATQAHSVQTSGLILEALAAAYAEIGDFEQAVKYEKECDSKGGIPAELAAAIKARLALYKAHKPYHEDMPVTKAKKPEDNGAF